MRSDPRTGQYDRRHDRSSWLFQLVVLLLGVWFSASAAAETTRYYYDDLGHVIQAIGSDGSIRQYQYDQNGNVTAINRITGGALTISGLSPSIGHVTASVTLFGSGFSPTPTQNDVRFGAIPATVTSASTTELTVTVPEGAVTGPISVTSGGNTATSATNYVVRTPAIQNFSPQFVNPGSPVTVFGSNLNLIPGQSNFSVGNVSATVNSIINGKAIIAAPTGSGLISVDTPYGDTSSAAPLSVLPVAVPVGNVVSFETFVPGAPAQSINVTQPGRHAVLRLDAHVGDLYALDLSSVVLTPSNNSARLTIYSPSGATFYDATIQTATNLLYLPQIPVTGTYLITMRLGTATAASFNVQLVLDPEITPNGDSFQISTSIVNERRRYSFRANAGDDLAVGWTNASASYRVTIIVKQVDGVTVMSNTCVPANLPGCALMLRDLPYTGYYDIEVYQFGNTSWVIDGTLTFSRAVAATLTPNTPLTVNLSSPGQYAVLTYTVAQGQNIAINKRAVTVVPSNRTLSMSTHISGPTQSQGNESTVNLPNLAAGTYDVVLEPGYAATATAQIELAAEMATPILADGSTANFATTLSGQQEYFTFEGVAGQSLGLALTSVGITPATGNIPITVERPNGTALAVTDSACYLNMQPGCQSEMRNLPETGTYRMRIAPSSYAKISFALTMSQHLTGALAFDTPLNLNLASPGRYALLTFTATAGQTIALNAHSFTTSPAGSAVKMTVYGPNGSSLGTHSSSTNPILNLQNLVAGTHTVVIQGVNAATVTMQVTLASGMTAVLPVDGVSRPFATTVKGQRGYFTFNAMAGQSVGIAVTDISTSPTLNMIVLEIRRPDGNSTSPPQLTCNPNSASSHPGCQLELRNLPLTGTYTITASTYLVNDLQMSFKLTISEHITGTLALDTPYPLSLAPGQHAWLSFTATQGQTVAVNANSFATTPAGKAVSIAVYNSSGAALGSSSNSVNPIVNLPDLAAGTYRVLVGATDAATANVEITLASGLTGALAVDGVSRSFAATVKDQNGYFTFEATAGQTLAMAVSGLSIVPATTFVNFDIRRPDGSRLVQPSCNVNTQPGCQTITLSLPATGTYKILTESFQKNGVMMGFTLILSNPDESMLSIGSPYSLTLGAPGGMVRLSFVASAGQTIILQASSISTTPVGKQVQLRAFNSSGTLLGTSQNASNPKLTLSNLAAGTYSLLINTMDAAVGTAQVTMQ